MGDNIETGKLEFINLDTGNTGELKTIKEIESNSEEKEYIKNNIKDAIELKIVNKKAFRKLFKKMELFSKRYKFAMITKRTKNKRIANKNLKKVAAVQIELQYDVKINTKHIRIKE